MCHLVRRFSSKHSIDEFYFPYIRYRGGSRHHPGFSMHTSVHLHLPFSLSSVRAHISQGGEKKTSMIIASCRWSERDKGDFCMPVSFHLTPDLRCHLGMGTLKLWRGSMTDKHTEVIESQPAVHLFPDDAPCWAPLVWHPYPAQFVPSAPLLQPAAPRLDKWLSAEPQICCSWSLHLTCLPRVDIWMPRSPVLEFQERSES